MGHWRKQRENKKLSGDKWKWKHSGPKHMALSKSSSKREVYADTSLPQKIRKISNTLAN